MMLKHTSLLWQLCRRSQKSINKIKLLHATNGYVCKRTLCLSSQCHSETNNGATSLLVEAMLKDASKHDSKSNTIEELDKEIEELNALLEEKDNALKASNLIRDALEEKNDDVSEELEDQIEDLHLNDNYVEELTFDAKDVFTNKKVASSHEEKSFASFPDHEEPISKVPCPGCGALLHCQNVNIPGYMPSHVSSSLLLSSLYSKTRGKHVSLRVCV